jgi:hypothetical protein
MAIFVRLNRLSLWKIESSIRMATFGLNIFLADHQEARQDRFNEARDKRSRPAR